MRCKGVDRTQLVRNGIQWALANTVNNCQLSDYQTVKKKTLHS